MASERALDRRNRALRLFADPDVAELVGGTDRLTSILATLTATGLLAGVGPVVLAVIFEARRKTDKDTERTEADDARALQPKPGR